ncbi:MAG TPA: MerR family transcriptional regulator [Phnomibacter sp.]|nr:MerR family transcriptional regulator [Phnomibacter sp.]
MQQFTISEVERLSGIKAHTLRIWEQRYGLARPHRKASSHRIYTNEDLKEILRVAFLYHRGVKISKIASLHPRMRLQLIESSLDKTTQPAQIIDNLLKACMVFDDETFDAIFKHQIAQTGLVNTMLEVAYPLMHQAGVHWMNDQILPVQEHFISMRIRHHLLVGLQMVERPLKQPHLRIALLTPEQEQHELPLLFVHYLAKALGHANWYIGANASLATAEAVCKTWQPTHIYVHQVTQIPEVAPQDYIAKLSAIAPNAQIIAGGAAMQSLQSNNCLTVINSHHQLVALLEANAN